MEQKKCENDGCENMVEVNTGRRPRKYCSDKCRISAFLKKKQPAKFVQKEKYEKLVQENEGLKQQIQDLTKPTNEVTPIVQPTTNYVIRRPKTLDELKLIVPEKLTGFDKSEWVAKIRQDYGI